MQVSRKVALEMQEGRAAEGTLERRLQILNELIAKTGVGTPEMKLRWQTEADDLEMTIETEKGIELAEAMAARFMYFREMVALACLEAEEVYKPSEEEKITLWLGSTGVDLASGEVVRRDDDGTDWKDERNSRPFPY